MRTPNDIAIEQIRRCLLDLKKTPRRNYRGFVQRSYLSWAAREMIARLARDPSTPPLITIEDFRYEMDEYSCVNPKTSYIFSCAKDMAEWVIDLLIA